MFQFALPRGERHKAAMLVIAISVFQFALPRGERRKIDGRCSHGGQFQFALPRGERPVQVYLAVEDGAVSIRAPARGATIDHAALQFRHLVSIRAPARGATRRPGQHNHAARFQFALPRGERRHRGLSGAGRSRFNSRSREGSDIPRPVKTPTSRVSIRAPARGATGGAVGQDFGAEVSIRAPARGATGQTIPS